MSTARFTPRVEETLLQLARDSSAAAMEAAPAERTALLMESVQYAEASGLGWRYLLAEKLLHDALDAAEGADLFDEGSAA